MGKNEEMKSILKIIKEYIFCFRPIKVINGLIPLTLEVEKELNDRA